LGNKWSEISKLLPGRAENAVKNRFNSLITKKIGRHDYHVSSKILMCCSIIMYFDIDACRCMRWFLLRMCAIVRIVTAVIVATIYDCTSTVTHVAAVIEL
jgi:Myb-like DNA-binding domain